MHPMRADLLREIEAAADAALATDDPLAVVAARLVIGVAVLLGVALARRSRAHWPVPIALGLALAVDVTRARLELPPAVELGLYLAVPALSAWCALMVLAKRALAGAVLAPLVVGGAPLWLAVVAPGLWGAAPIVAHGASLLVQAAAAALWWRSPRSRDVSVTCVGVLAAGDVVGLLGPLALGGPWWIVALQAGGVASALVLVQGWALFTRSAVERVANGRYRATRSSSASPQVNGVAGDEFVKEVTPPR